MLHLTQYGPKNPLESISYSAITTDKEHSCASTNEDGTEHTWPYNGCWLAITDKALMFWKGCTKTEIVVIRDGDGNIVHEHTLTFGLLK